ncbi:MAG: hypothetical protein V1852_21525 [Pseudomonadota bacterium]
MTPPDNLSVFEDNNVFYIAFAAAVFFKGLYTEISVGIHLLPQNGL